MDALYYIANKLWIALCKREAHLHQKAIKDVKSAQQNLLLTMIEENKQTEYGRRHCFSEIRNARDFREYVPITDYTDYETSIGKIMDGEENILTSEPVIMFELSSGSSAPSKHIPYTRSLKKQFIAGINPWVRNLYSNFKGLYWGKSYWSITPVNVNKSKTRGGIPIGFEEDSQYFGFLEKNLLDLLFAVPNEVKFIDNMDAFRYVTLLFLLKEKRLSLISVWNPSFLFLLLKPLNEWKEQLMKDLENGSICPPGPIPLFLARKLGGKLKKNPDRAKEISSIFKLFIKNEKLGNRSLYEMIWPKLKIISCWTDANAAMYVDELSRMFPNTEIQGKGLIATEGFISFPFVGEEGARISIRSHFFEFEEVDFTHENANEIKLVHELEQGRKYSVIITTGGGFYRYRLQDVIEVTGFSRQCPRIKFLGKAGGISDLCGEKLNDLHVRLVVEKSLKKNGMQAAFFMVAPEIEKQEKSQPYYVLFLEPCASQNVQAKELKEFISTVEDGLRENFHYNYCRQLEQLGCIRLFIIKSNGCPAGLETYHRVCQSSGMREGNIKPCALHNKTGWTREFRGEFV